MIELQHSESIHLHLDLRFGGSSSDMLLCCSGRSLGTAEVLFKSSDDAQKAIQQYNQVALDGKPMGLKLLDSAQPKRSVLRSST